MDFTAGHVTYWFCSYSISDNSILATLNHKTLLFMRVETGLVSRWFACNGLQIAYDTQVSAAEGKLKIKPSGALFEDVWRTGCITPLIHNLVNKMAARSQLHVLGGFNPRESEKKKYNNCEQ
jgi:hypothetical protein